MDEDPDSDRRWSNANDIRRTGTIIGLAASGSTPEVPNYLKYNEVVIAF
ncbi:MAG TPA: hypothetical protein VNZ86_10220 [Bacteroidia bacterium]|nr:hypothetical protein [Bacteroidia bacterium]